MGTITVKRSSKNDGLPYQQLGKFVDLFESLESSLIQIIGVVTDKDCAVEILPAETKYQRLVVSADVFFSGFIDLLDQPDLEAKARFHELMEKCLNIGVVRNRLMHAKYALLSGAGNVVTPVSETAELNFKGGARGLPIAEDLSVESFEPYLQQIAGIHAELESFRLQVIKWKSSVDSATIKTGRS